jgi:hypothetical protein
MFERRAGLAQANPPTRQAVHVRCRIGRFDWWAADRLLDQPMATQVGAKIDIKNPAC